MQSHLSLVRKQVRGVGCRSSTSSSSLEGCPRSYRSREHQERQASRPTIYNDRRDQALLVSVADREQASGPLPLRLPPKPTLLDHLLPLAPRSKTGSLPPPLSAEDAAGCATGSTRSFQAPMYSKSGLLSLYLGPYVSSVRMATQKVHWRITQLQYLLLKYSQQPLRGFQGSSKGTS